MKYTGWCQNDFNVLGYLHQLRDTASDATPMATWSKDSAAHPAPPDARPNGPPALGVDIKSHSGATLNIVYRERLANFTEWCQNDFTIQG
jgi:hypothetical protein